MAEDQEILMDEQVETGDPKPKLREQDRVRLDSIVQRMIRNRESDAAIRTVVDDFKRKYVVLSSPETMPAIPKPVVPKPKPKEPQLWDYGFEKVEQPDIPTVDYSKPTTEPKIIESVQITPGVEAQKGKVREETATRFGTEVKKAQKTLYNELIGNDDVIETDIRNARGRAAGEAKTDEMMTSPRSDMPGVQDPRLQFDPRVQQEVLAQDQPVTPEDIQKEKQKIATDEMKARNVLEQVSRLKPEKSGQIQSALYKLDIATSLAEEPNVDKRLPKILQNAKDLEKGKLLYNPRNGQLVKPENIIQSFKTAWKQKEQNYDDFDKFRRIENNEAIAMDLDKRMEDRDPDEPLPVPEGVLGSLGSGLGGMPLKVYAAAAAGSLAGPGGAAGAGAAVGAREAFKLGWANEFQRAYYELRQQGLSGFEAVERARQQADNAANIDAIVGGVSGLVAARIPYRQMTPVNFSGGFRKAVVSALKGYGQVLSPALKEGIIAGGIAAGGERYKNELANEAGIDRDADENIFEVAEMNLLIPLAIGAVTGAAKISKSGYRHLMQGLHNIPEGVFNNALTDAVGRGIITEEQSTSVKNQVEEYGNVDDTIPKNIAPEARVEIQGLIERRNELETQIENTDKAFHPELKEKVKAIEEKITELSKDRVKPDKEQAEVKSLIDEGIAEGLPGYGGIMKDVALNDPNGFMKMIADQALGRTETGALSDLGNAEYAAREAFGDAVVDKALKMYPLQPQKPKVTVSTPVIRNVRAKEGAIPEFDIQYEGGKPTGTILQGKDLIAEGSESTVYRDGDTVIKVSEPYNDASTFNARVEDARIISQQLGDGSVELIGTYKSKNGTLNPVFRQKFIEGEKATHEQINAYMESKGFQKKNGGWENDQYRFTDIDSDNAIVDANGKVHIIDAGVKKINPNQFIQDLFDGTKSTLDIISGLKNITEDKFINDQIDSLIPYLSRNPGIKFSKMFSVGRGEAHLTGDWTVLLSRIKDKKQLTQTVLHELYHAISVNKLLKDESFEKSIDSIRKEAVSKLGLEQYLKDSKNTDFGSSKEMRYYGLLDNKEFIAELFSSKEFNELLDGIKEKDQTTLLDKVVNKIKNIIGIKEVGYSQKIKESILKGIEHKIELENDPLIKKIVENTQKAHRPEEFIYNEYKSSETIKPTQDAIPEQSTSTKGQAQEEGEPISTEPPMSGITHAKMDEMSRRLGFPEYEKGPEKQTEWIEQAQERIKANPKAIPELIDKMRNGGIPDPVEQKMMGIYVADLEAKLAKDPMNDTIIADLKRAKDLSNIAGGRLTAQSLVARQGLRPVEETLGDFYQQEQEATGTTELTQKQKETNLKEYIEIKEAETVLQNKEAEAVTKEQDNKAQGVINEVKKKTPRQPKKDYKKERTDIIASIRDKLKKSRGEASAVVVPYAKELFAIAPDVAKLVKSLVEEGIDKLPAVIDAVHEQIKDLIDGVTKEDVRALIAGDYNEKKPLKNTLLAKMRDLRDHAKLIGRYQELIAGVEPKTEKARKARIKEIEDLKEKIKEHDLTKLAAAKSRMEKEIQKIQKQLADGDFSVPEKKEIKLDREGQEMKDRLIKLRKDREIRLAQEQYANRSRVQRWIDISLVPVRELRTLWSSFDYSMPGRQGIVPTAAELLTSPGKTKERFKNMFIASANEKFFDRYMFDLKNSGEGRLAEKSGVAITEPGKFDKKEEVFQSRYLEKIPGIGTIGIKGSERAAAFWLNDQRMGLFMEGVKRMQENGRTYENSKEAYENWASVVNTLTGKGELVGSLKNASGLLSHLFFSPKLMASRLAFFNPWFYAKIPKELRGKMAADMGKFLGFGIGILALANMFGAETEYDPRSADFGKIKVDGTRWDIWGGFQQYFRLFAQIATMSKKTASGKVQSLWDQDRRGGRKLPGTLANFFRSKTSPIVSTVWDIAEGKNVVGQPVTGGNIWERFLPLIVKDFIEVGKKADSAEEAAIGAAKNIPAIFGVGTMTY